MSPSDALRLKLANGDYVKVYIDLGSVVMIIRISGDIALGTLWVPRQARTVDGKRINALLTDSTEELGGGSVINSTRVKIYKIEYRRLKFFI